MIDITDVIDSQDLGVLDTQVPRAANILSIQRGSLEYAPTLGPDIKYFLSEDFEFQNESFKAYLVEVLANEGVNVSSVTETLTALSSDLIFNISREETSTGLIAR